MKLVPSLPSPMANDEAPRLGAALAFYTILSLAPLVILAIAIAGLIFGHSTAQSQLLGQVDSMIGRQGSEAAGANVARLCVHGAYF